MEVQGGYGGGGERHTCQAAVLGLPGGSLRQHGCQAPIQPAQLVQDGAGPGIRFLSVGTGIQPGRLRARQRQPGRRRAHALASCIAQTSSWYGTFAGWRGRATLGKALGLTAAETPASGAAAVQRPHTRAMDGGWRSTWSATRGSACSAPTPAAGSPALAALASPSSAAGWPATAGWSWEAAADAAASTGAAGCPRIASVFRTSLSSWRWACSVACSWA